MSVKELSHKIDFSFHHFTSRYGIILLEISIGIIYFWFGALKLFPNISPAEELAGDTLFYLTLGFIPKTGLLSALAICEMTIGIFLLFRIKHKAVTWILLFHMIGTLSPMLIFPDLIFHDFPFSFTIVGQYIMKNLVIISAALVTHSTRCS